MTNKPEGTIETPLGAIRYIMTCGEHVFLHTEARHGEARHGEAITIRGIPYHVSFHCHLIGGEWGAKDTHEPYLARKDTYAKDASAPARKTALTELTKAWAAFIAANPGIARQATIADAELLVHNLGEALAELKSKAAGKQAELDAAQAALSAARKLPAPNPA